MRKGLDTRVQNRPKLGQEDWEPEPIVKSVKTVLDAWRDLLIEADSTILDNKRNGRPQLRDKFRLSYVAPRSNVGGDRPAF